MAADPYASIAHDPYATIASPPPAAPPGESPLKGIGDALQGGYRNVQAARTSAARDPVGALGNVFNAIPGAVSGAVMAPMQEHVGNDVGKFLRAEGHGLSAAVNPKEADRYEKAFGDMTFNGMRPQGDSLPARGGRGAEDFALQTMIPGQGLPFKALGAVAGPVAKGITSAVKPLGEYVDKAKGALQSPEVKRFTQALGPAAQKIGEINPIRGLVNAGKDVLFLNPAPHGVGNMGILNYLKNGIGTTAKGFKYGVTGTPQATQDTLAHIGAGAWTPELMGKSSPWGPVGMMQRLPGPTVAKAALGATAGGVVGNQTTGADASPQDRLNRVLEGAAIGGITGGSPALRTGSNKVMERLETGHRGAMLESLPKPRFRPGADQKVAEAVDPRAAAINATFGGGKKSAGATIATAAGGPFSQWLMDIVPRNVGSAIAKNPERVAALTRAQNITNRDVLGDQPYKVQMGGPVGDFAELLTNPVKYGTRIAGPLTQQDPSALTKPDSFNLGDQLKGAAYNMLPGRSVVGPFVGDTMYPSKAPAVPNAALGAVLGWHMSNKAPSQEAILNIMRTTGLDQYKATQLYQRYKR